MERVVLGTAGHVDHGKTALVKALTGTDTDRLQEEKRRGITIDLGFADLVVESTHFSIVDVPGHEDFVRNMVAGATGIDVTLFVVAADEGLMPQSEEHLAILDFLSVPVGVPVITKVDTVDPEWLELVRTDVIERLSASPCDWADPVCCSAITGEGMDELRVALTAAAGRARGRSETDLFRMPVDRAFTVAGTGTVATGTVWSGSLKQGEEATVLPGDRRTRVRAIEVHGAASSEATPGRRTALALTGIDRGSVQRGAVIVSDPLWQATDRIDVSLSLLQGARPLGQRSRIRVHLGTAEVMARVTPALGEIPPGGTGGARLRLEQPVVARWGDRGVLRSYSPVTTVGGIVVVDPFPPPRPRRPVDWEGKSALDVATRVAAFVAADGRLPLRDLAVRLGLNPGDCDRINAGPPPGIAAVGQFLMAHADIDGLLEKAISIVTAFHSASPLEAGFPVESLRPALGKSDIADHLLDRWRAAGEFQINSGRVKLPGFQAELSPTDRKMAGEILQRLETAGSLGAAIEDMDSAATAEFRAVLGFLVRTGKVTRVGGERFYHTGVLNGVTDVVVGLAAAESGASPAEVRAKTGLTRKYLIPLLEWMDSQGITVRDGDVRRLGPTGRNRTQGRVG